jgi:hypothetical protein
MGDFTELAEAGEACEGDEAAAGAAEKPPLLTVETKAFKEDEDIAELMRVHKVEGEKLVARAAAAAAATAKATAAAEDKKGADPWKDADPWKHPDVKTKIRDLEDKIEALHKLFTKGEQKGGYEDKKDAKEEVDDDGNPTGILSLKKLDRKDVDKPDKYSGGPDAWLKWSKQFKKFLRRQDDRWPGLLEAVEGRSWNTEKRGQPFLKTDEDELQLMAELKLGKQLPMFKEQLNEYLETYTSGSAKVTVEACGDARALDAWRQMADKGNSMREHHANVLRRKAYFPKSGGSLKDIENTIMNWEADIELFVKATGEDFPERLKRMMLLDLCPEALSKHLKAMEHIKRFEHIDAIKLEISDWLADQPAAKGRAAALEPAGGDEAAPEAP